MVNITINDIPLQVEDGITILDASRQAGVHIPTLCHLKDINQIGACRVCLVEIKGARALQASCCYPVSEGLAIYTNTKKVRDARKTVVELILSDHNRSCLTCIRNQSCELQALADELGIDKIPYKSTVKEPAIDDMSPSVVRDNSKCILCRRCVAVCENVQTVYAIGPKNRGFKTEIGSIFDRPLAKTQCINCGQCITACPVGALYEKDATKAVWDAINDPDKYVVMQTAPAVRVALGEAFGMPMGSRVTDKMAAAMRRLGVNKCFDTDFAADLTIMEEGTEFIHRLQNGGKLPLITSCSPGWIKFAEHYYHDMLDNLSTCKSPHEMMGAVVKTHFARQANIDPKNIFMVSIMPCTAKKFEAQRPELSGDGLQDVDAVLTTREFARMIKQAGIDFVQLADEPFDDLWMSESTGAAVIFGATGGVMEAALRTVVEILTGEELKNINFTAVRGIDGVKEATLNVAGTDVRVAVANSTGCARQLLDRVRAGEAYHFIEIMGCPGGCVTGGGQPIVSARTRRTTDPRTVRAAAIYDEDEAMTLRKSHLNPSVKKLYADFLEKPGSHKAHALLHTHYAPRP